MIDERVVEIAQGFRQYWSDLFVDYPRYQLDLTWPSVGVVELILSSLEGESDLNELQEEMIFGAAAYLAVMAQDCWSLAGAKPKMSLSLVEGEGQDIVIGAKGGSSLKANESFRVGVYRNLREVLRNPPDPFPYFESYACTRSPGQGVVSLFAIGLMSGLCPYGVGPWREVDFSDAKAIWSGAYIFLPKTASQYYARVFLGEEYGREKELYQQNLIIPPIGAEEKFFAQRATKSLASYLVEKKLPADEMERLALNLASVTDDLIAGAGFAVAAALVEKTAPRRLRVLGEVWGSRAAQLRPAVVLAREALERPQGWLELFDEEEGESALEMIEIERSLGLLPFLRLNNESLVDARLRKLLFLISWSQPGPALIEISELRNKGVESLALELQQVFLGFMLGEFQEAAEHLLRIESDAHSKDDWHRREAIEIAGMLARKRLEYSTAIERFQLALSLADAGGHAYSRIAAQLVEVFIENNEQERALETAEEALAKDDSSFSLLFSRALLRKGLGEGDIVGAIEELARLAPANAMVFQLLAVLLEEERTEEVTEEEEELEEE